ncbi:MAG: hypothetical protein JF627_03605 [Alphaproteobacteria bacterium]|nr:hypothetical protein [Alphaproteobacteria bacterium]
MTAVREKQIQQYVESHAVASRVAGKLGRWESPICVKAEGLKPELLEFVVRRIKAVATQIGAAVNSDPSCEQNVEIGFSSDPQSVLDYIRDKHINYLGFYNNMAEAEKMARMTHPIQAWYATFTIDASGESISDTRPSGPPKCFDPPLCRFMVSAPVVHSTGTRVSDGLRTGFRNVIVLTDRDRLAKMEMGAVADYISFLVLAQPRSLDDCTGLPSILNSFAAHCTANSDELSVADLSFLAGLYRMNTDRLLAGQKEQIAFQMKKALGAR